MNPWVVDASVAIKWLVAEVHADRAEALLRADAEILAPDLIGPEINSALWKRVRRAEITAEEAGELLLKFDRFGIAIHPCQPLIHRAIALAVALDHSPYDCLYLALSEEAACPLVTADRRFYDTVRRGKLAASIVWIEDAV
jgi:predicted nucleic acid-binding protein